MKQALGVERAIRGVLVLEVEEDVAAASEVRDSLR